ncbi:restriction endonuclease subunit S [Helicobacter pylori]|uniref:restriction endonuclease subunit S n=1 Tax=Helicobacter pylori TaxID=210 RepID=UPI0029286A6D|nr:restriction endonuclease subunit S [Helicobacter pylori]MDU9702837.1 restriction endonuclease subunit S [Helicobacter pylori]
MDTLTTPLNWQRVRLGDILTLKHGRDYKNFKLGNIPVYGSGGYMLSINNFLHNGESVCIGRKGTIDKPIYLNGKSWVVDTLFYSYSFKKSIPKFIFYAFSIIKWSNYNEATGVPSLTKMTISNIEIPLPPLNEQIAIANILSALDRYLCALDALILKKEGVKKALSFELLNQRKRLKGFNQNWQRVRLRDICEFGNGGAYETLIVENGDFKLISLNSIDIDGNLKNTMKRVNFYDNSLKQDDIVMVLSDVAHGDFLGLCAVIPSNDYMLNQRMGRLRKRNDCINILFLRLYINANQKYFKMQGQGSSQLNLSKKAIEDFEILLPPLNEQIAIANILSALDHEIASLKNKKRQFDNIKKALNHDLMSAKIRVLKK